MTVPEVPREGDISVDVASTDYPIRACAWPRRERIGRPVRLITREEFEQWILFEDSRLLVVNKPGDVVCHPSKAGPWSSLVGAAREYTGLPRIHLVFRLDRETSGVVVMTKESKTAGRLQTASQDRRIAKRYWTILTGELTAAVTVNQPLGPDLASAVYVKSTVVAGPDSQEAVTHFSPLATGGGFSFAQVDLETGRKHQIRAHARWLGYPVVGDKIYGPDDRLYLEFIDHGWTEALAERLLLPRQALHCAEIGLAETGLPAFFRAPLPEDLRRFCAERGIDPDAGKK